MHRLFGGINLSKLKSNPHEQLSGFSQSLLSLMDKPVMGLRMVLHKRDGNGAEVVDHYISIGF